MKYFIFEEISFFRFIGDAIPSMQTIFLLYPKKIRSVFSPSSGENQGSFEGEAYFFRASVEGRE